MGRCRSATLAEVVSLFRQSHAEQLPYIAGLTDADLAGNVEMPWISDGAQCSLAEMLLQVVMHSQNHRGQCLSRLRALGGSAPTLDFILWAKDHPAAAW
ncbi:MAG: DinB family protein [Bryobacteraceae bacterium]